MANNEQFLLMSLLFLSVAICLILYLNWNTIKNIFANIFFGKSYKKPKYICPICGSRDWKFPNPIKPAERMINTYQLVNNLFECKKCGHIGIFFAVDDPNSIKYKKHNETIENKIAYKNKLTLRGWAIFYLTLLLLFFFTQYIVDSYCIWLCRIFNKQIRDY